MIAFFSYSSHRFLVVSWFHQTNTYVNAGQGPKHAFVQNIFSAQRDLKTSANLIWGLHPSLIERNASRILVPLLFISVAVDETCDQIIDMTNVSP